MMEEGALVEVVMVEVAFEVGADDRAVVVPTRIFCSRRSRNWDSLPEEEGIGDGGKREIRGRKES